MPEQDDVGQPLVVNALDERDELLSMGGAHAGRIEPAQAMGDGIENGAPADGPTNTAESRAPDAAGNLA
jgi:hypothetical protein